MNFKVCFLIIGVDSRNINNTFPRGFPTTPHTADVDGHMTFPRSGNMSSRRPDLGSTYTSIASPMGSRSIMSRGSDGTLSTSSSSSGILPDPDLESPESRLMKRNSDLDSPIFPYGTDFSKCKCLCHTYEDWIFKIHKRFEKDQHGFEIVVNANFLVMHMQSKFQGWVTKYFEIFKICVMC